MNALTSHNELADSEAQPNKPRRKKSIVWDHFTIEPIDADCTKACCKQCKKSFAYISGSKLAGTSHLKRHIALGICPVGRNNQEKNQPTTYNDAAQIVGSASATSKSRKRYRANPGPTSIPFDQVRCCYEIAKMIIQHDYPLEMVEHLGFNDFARSLQPFFSPVSVNTIQDHICNIYLREKQNLLNIIDAIPGRVSLTLDLRTSDQSLGYVFLTGYFVDCDWKLQRRLLNVIMVPFPDSEVAFNHAVTACLTDWCLETKLFTLTLDQSIANDNVRKNLRHLLSIKGGNILNGQLIIGSCCARTMSHLAQYALDSLSAIVEKVRQSVKFVKKADAHEKMFLEVKTRLQVPSAKELIVDDLTRWDTTYQMLMIASELKEVFSCLDDTSDPDYKETPTMDEWRQVETLCAYLKRFYDTVNILTSPTYPTANMFFNDVCSLHSDLKQDACSMDHFVSNLTKPLHEIIDRYWNDCNLVLAVAVVMDPRFKMKLVEFSFDRIYGKEEAETWIKIVDEGVHELFCDYIVQSLPPPTFVDEANEDIIVKSEFGQEESFLTNGDTFADFDVYLHDIMSNQHMKTELDQYLEEELLPRSQDFDVLGWWRIHRAKYPTLSKMASDILSIPVCTVSPDNVFDTAPRDLDNNRSSLEPRILETISCAKDWLQYESFWMPPPGMVKMEY